MTGDFFFRCRGCNVPLDGTVEVDPPPPYCEPGCELRHMERRARRRLCLLALVARARWLRRVARARWARRPRT